MVEITKDFIKFIAQVILLLVIFSVVFDPERGIVANTFNYLIYAEPILLQDHISTAITTASHTPGEFSTSFKTTGIPYIIKIYKEDDKPYVSIDLTLVQQQLLSTRFAVLEPIPILTDCNISDQKITLERNLIQTITVKKTLENGCKISVIA